MKPQLSKIKTYIGFAIRSRQIIYGVDDIIKRDFKGLVLMSNALAESSANKLTSHVTYAGGQVLSFESEEFAELFGENITMTVVTESANAPSFTESIKNEFGVSVDIRLKGKVYRKI